MFKFLETVIIGMVGGFLFHMLQLPLAWMLGPLTAVIVWRVFTKRELNWPVGFKNGGQFVLGYSMGLSFTAESARQILHQFPSMVLSTTLMVGFGLVMATLISKFTTTSFPSAVMGTTPGGLSQMVVLSEEIKGAEPTIVTFMQTIRMLTVIFIVPTLAIHTFSSAEAVLPMEEIAGAEQSIVGLGTLFYLSLILIVTKIAVHYKCPTPWIIGPLLSVAILSITGMEPSILPASVNLIAQLCLGIYLGLSMKVNMLGDWKRLLPITLLSGLSIVGFAFFLAYVLQIFYPMTMATAFLCIAPGGLPEMGVTAHTVKADVSLVAAYQLFRVFFILFIVPIFLRGYFGKDEHQHKEANVG
ncbi:AbrB family transcriptional regulator [Metabacillus niabensis]|uniref:AbrB family transcriptional regulator n=1 Tax=Metabacillus niabensis TaxID=324854 RepID=UPI001CFB6259|nr:AbrB family transcriptional regulator [Metabacillus niabensis]